MTSVASVATTAGLVGFGNSASAVAISPVPSLDLTGGLVTLLDMAFSMPRAGTITSLAVLFSNVGTTGLPGGATATLTVQLYTDTVTRNTFLPIAGALLTLPITAVVGTLGLTAEGIASLAVPVVAGQRLLLVATVSVSNEAAFVTAGYLSAGVALA